MLKVRAWRKVITVGTSARRQLPGLAISLPTRVVPTGDLTRLRLVSLYLALGKCQLVHTHSPSPFLVRSISQTPFGANNSEPSVFTSHRQTGRRGVARGHCDHILGVDSEGSGSLVLPLVVPCVMIVSCNTVLVANQHVYRASTRISACLSSV